MGSLELVLPLNRTVCAFCRRTTKQISLFKSATHLTRSVSTLRPPENEQINTIAQVIKSDQPPVMTQDRLRYARVVPASPAYFTTRPRYTDSLLALQALLRKYETLPTVSGRQVPLVSWKTPANFKVWINEPITSSKYSRILVILKRLNRIHPEVMPIEVTKALEVYKKAVEGGVFRAKPAVIDELGRAKGVGRRKTSWAHAYVVEGDGEVLINDRPLNQMFGRMHDRESVIWPLKATQRIDKYNVWALVKGGGVTGQAEALTLAIAKALLIHEPALKPALRRAGCVTRDPRKVERKKTGRLKARKMPAWVAR